MGFPCEGAWYSLSRRTRGFCPHGIFFQQGKALLVIAFTVPRGATILMLLLAAGVVSAAALDAQARPPDSGSWSVDVGAGIGVPGAVINETVTLGPAGGVGIATALGRHVALRADVSVAFEPGKDLVNTFGPGGVPLTQGPDITLVHYTIGLEVFPVSTSARPWWMSATVMVGGTSTTGSGGSIEPGPWLTAGVGARVGRRVSSRMAIWLGARAYAFVVGHSGEAAIDANLPVLAGIRLGI